MSTINIEEEKQETVIRGTEEVANASNTPVAPYIASKEHKIKWTPFLFITAIHIAALGVFFVPFSWGAVGVCVALHWITGGLGITLCYHRLLTHRSFKMWKPLEYLCTIFACLACESGPISWVAAHRLHHAKSDQPGDPHSPREGFFWAHMGWCLSKNKDIDDFEVYKKLAPDLAKDPVHVFLDKYNIIWTFLLAGGLYAWGGWSYVVWGIFMRVVLVYHSTWFVNSATHVWGYQNFKSDDDSTNLWWVALLSYGEGWHNNHHTFQSSARHGLKPWELDSTYMVIKVLQFFKLAWDIKIPTPRLLATKA